MFEAIATFCLLAAPDICRDVLLPGYEAQTQATCEAKLEGHQPELADSTPVSQPRCQMVGPIGRFEEISGGVYAHLGAISDAAPENYGDVANIGFIVGETSVAVIDTGGTRKVAEEIYRAIRARTDLPVSHVILTHMHPDHVLGAALFAQIGATVVGHEKLGSALTDRAETYLTNFGELIGQDQFVGTTVVLPDMTVSETPSIDLGGRVIELQSWQTSHTTNDLTVLDPTSGVMFTGDLVFHQHAPALDGSVRGWVEVLDIMKGLPVKRIVPGHGGPVLDWPGGAKDLSRYLHVLTMDTEKALNAGRSLSTAAETIATSEAENWELFELFNARNATVAFTELEWE
ncbi:MAG: quinoprotein relay system zinc metallohydrolase 2 [Paracoccaceae bacterium]